MIDSIFVRASVPARLHQNPLQPHLEQLATTLHEQGYARSSIRDCVLAGDKFGWWLQRQGCVGTEIDETLLERYLAGLQRYRFGKRCKAAAGLNHLIRILRQQGVVAERQAATPIAPVDQWLARYEQYMEQVVGAVVGTRQRYRPIVRQFIIKCCISGEVNWSSLCAPTITEFVCKQATARQSHGRKMPSVAVRSFLRFLVFEGEINRGLEAAAPPPPQWTHAALPVRLTSEQVEQVLAVYEEKTASSLRNRAMLLLLARLGLRAKEVLILGLDDIDFEQQRGNTVSSRNVRLSAVRSFFRLVALRDPESIGFATRVLVIPVKREDKKLIGYLTRTEIQALLAAPDRSQWAGQRDHALFSTLYNSGARVSEIIALKRHHICFGATSFLQLTGKGRKQRTIPLWSETSKVLKAWFCKLGNNADGVAFPNARGKPLSRDGVDYLLKQAVRKATINCPSLATKTITPHIVRHATAMHLLQAGVDIATIALWLGHESIETTHVYLEADLALKEKALGKLDPVNDGHMLRFKADNSLLEFLASL